MTKFVIFLIIFILLISLWYLFMSCFNDKNYLKFQYPNTYKNYKYLWSKISDLKIIVNNEYVIELESDNIKIAIYRGFIYISVNEEILLPVDKYYWDTTIDKLSKRFPEII